MIILRDVLTFLEHPCTDADGGKRITRDGLDGDGAVQNYFNSSMSQEMVYTTSGASADVSGGGIDSS